MNRNGHYWTPQEEGLILLRIAEGKSLDEIAKEVSRTSRAVGWRRDAMIRHLFRRGRSCAFLADLFVLKLEDLENIIRVGYPMSPNCL